MNTEKLHAIAFEIKTDIEQLQIVKLLQQLTTHLQNVVNQPQQAQHQENLSKVRNSLLEKLSVSRVNEFSPAWYQALEEIGICDYLGANLANKVSAIFAENQITPQVALQEIQKLHTKVTEIHTNLTNLINSFTYLEIGRELLSSGEGEVGILLPREYIDNRFDKLAKEFKELNGILVVLSEVGTGSAEHFELKQLSTTDPLITLGASLAALSTIAVAIKPIISAYKEILEVRILHAKLADMKVESKRLKGIEEHAEEIMERAIEKIKDELMAESPIAEEGRKNELSNALGMALSKLANRIDRGFNIEVRVEPVEVDEGSEEEESEDIKNIRAIEGAMKEMKFMNVDGKPILHLPESVDDN
jgi:hypothetical protein